MTLYLVRHAKAGSRASWQGDDRLRPLSARGQRQAEAIAELLTGQPFGRVVTSPYVRCSQTVAPLAERRALDVEEHESLAEGADLAAVLALVDGLLGCGAVICSHGDVIPMLLDHLSSLGLDLGPEPECAKASTWILDSVGPVVNAARYVPPPAV